MPYLDPDEQRKFQREWLAKKRAEYLADKCCAVCGSKNRMEIDHIDSGKKISHRVWSWSKDRQDAELTKCQILCHAHHLEKTKKDFGYGDHGCQAYRRGCRCDLCAAWKRSDNSRRAERHWGGR